MAPQGLPVIMLFLAALFWSTSGVLIKLVDWTPLAITGWRAWVAAGVIYALCRREIRVSWGWAPLVVAGCMPLFSAAFVASTKLTTAANAIALQYTAPILVAVVAPRLLGEPTRRSDWFFLALTVGGIGLFFLDHLSLDGLWGIGLALFAAVLWACTALAVRGAKESSTAWPLTLGNLTTGMVCLPFMFQGDPGPGDWLGVVLLGVVSLGLGYAVFSYAAKRVTALESLLIPAVEPLMNPLWVFLATGETPGPWAVVGGLVVVSSVLMRGWLTVRRARRALVVAPTPA